MKFFLAGYYGFKNLGDELLLYKIYSDIKSLFEESEFYIWSGNKDFTGKFINNDIANIAIIDRFSLKETLQAIEKSDIIIMGGGGLIHEYYKINIEDLFMSFGYNVVAYSAIPLFAKIYNKKVFYWGIGHGPIFTKNAVNFAKWFYSLADVITVRDEYSFSSINNILQVKDNIFLDIDPVLDLNLGQFLKSTKTSNAKLIGINIRPWFNDEIIIEELSKAINNLLEEFDFKVALIPVDLQLDKAILAKLSHNIAKEKILELAYNDIPDIITAISLCDYFVGMRLHALMCAYKLSIPVLGLSYDIKTDNFLESIGASFINIAKPNWKELESRIKSLVLLNKKTQITNFEYKTPLIFKSFTENFSMDKRTDENKNIDFIEKDIAYMQNFIDLLRTKNEALTQELSLKQSKIDELIQELSLKQSKIDELIQELSLKQSKIDELEGNLNNEINQKNQLYNQLNQIYSSDFWKLANFYYRIKSRAPAKHIIKILSILRREGVRGIYNRTKNFFINSTTEQTFDPYSLLNPVKPIEVIVIDKDYSNKKNDITYEDFSVVVPVKNEENNIDNFLTSLVRQTIKPKEIIIIDDSTDKTTQKIKDFIEKTNNPSINLLTLKGSISKKRNLGLKIAKTQNILFVDAGNSIPNNLFENLIGAINDYPSADLIAGIYKPLKDNYWSYQFIPNWDHLNFNEYLPAARALLIKKEKALEIGGFAEFLPYTGEDTLFDLNYRKISRQWIINKSAVVFWQAPQNRKEALKKAFNYGIGDGHNGYGNFRFYNKLTRVQKNKKNTFFNNLEKAMFRGFLKGRSEKTTLLTNNDLIKGVVLILSGIPFTDSGGGQRGTQLSLEFMKKNFKVVFCNVYQSFEKKEKIFLDIEYPFLELYYLEDFNIEEFFEIHKVLADKTLTILEFPHPNFIPIIEKYKKLNQNTKIIYDCIDNWDSSLGWVWYSKNTELKIINLADTIITSAKTLKCRLEKMTEKQVYLVPNAVNLRLFNKNNLLENINSTFVPKDKKILIYVGALWGDWFDWGLLEKISKTMPDILILLVGNAPEDKINFFSKYDNVKFLGLQPQFKIPAILNLADICIIPFKYDEKIIKFTNPLKAYEYLAMGKPIVATFMDELVGLPFVYLAKNHEEFIKNINYASEKLIDEKIISKFLIENSWSDRVEKIIKIAGFDN
jgi:polysaccharide pyruvyl transferase CsaB